jgi:regulator of replication initiation timing
MAVRKPSAESLLNLQSNEELYSATEQLRNDVDTATAQVSSLTQRVSSMKDDLMLLQREVTKLKSGVSNDMKKVIGRMESIRKFGR